MFSKINRSLKEIFNFGFIFFIEYRIIGRIYGRKYKQNIIYKYLSKRYIGIASNRPAVNSDIGRNEQEVEPIWVCWWQGAEYMPRIVKACYRSLISHNNGHPVNLITKDNYNSFIELPSSLLRKFHDGYISITHFSDMLRMALLSRYGGLWIDSTIYITADLPKKFPSFFTIKQLPINDLYVSEYKWTGYCIGGTDSHVLFKRIYDILSEYWENHKYIIDYFLLDYIIKLIYDQDMDVQNLIDSNSESNESNFFLLSHINELYDESEFQNICRNTFLHKLTWKGILNERTKEGGITYYGKIVSSI